MTMRRYNLVPKVIGQPTNYEWEAADDGVAVQADEAIELQRVADEMADALKMVVLGNDIAQERRLTMQSWPESTANKKANAALADYARVKGGK